MTVQALIQLISDDETLLSKLNTKQREAVEFYDSRRGIAGAGSGKTACLLQSLAEQEYRPIIFWRLHNKAAREMKSRCRLVGERKHVRFGWERSSFSRCETSRKKLKLPISYSIRPILPTVRLSLRKCNLMIDLQTRERS